MLVAPTGRHIGIAIPACEGFEFLVTDPDFGLLDGSRFRRLEQLEQAARSMARIVSGPQRSAVIAVPIGDDGCAERVAQLRAIAPKENTLLND
jgi:hypothetical protein